MYPAKFSDNVESDFAARLLPFNITMLLEYMRVEIPGKPISDIACVQASQYVSCPIVPQPVIVGEEFPTIGAFYDYVINLTQTVNTLYPQALDPTSTSRQVTFPQSARTQTFRDVVNITDIQAAVNALKIIIDEGEGSSTEPFIDGIDPTDVGTPAHYYRFEQIYVGGTLIPAPTGRGFAFNLSENITFNPSGVFPFPAQPRTKDYANNSQELTLVNQFNANYSFLLNSLQAAFNGYPHEIVTAIGFMQALSGAVQDMKTLSYTRPGIRPAAPTFEFIPNLSPPTASPAPSPPPSPPGSVWCFLACIFTNSMFMFTLQVCPDILWRYPGTVHRRRS